MVNVLGHKRNEDFIAMFDAYLPAGDYCGQRIPITGRSRDFISKLSKLTNVSRMDRQESYLSGQWSNWT